MRQLHLLRLFAHHHQQHHAEKNPSRDQHLSIGETLLKNKCQDGYQSCEHNAQQRAFQHYAAAQPQIIALQKKNHLESFAVKRSESEQDQSPPEMPLRNFDRARIFQQRFPPAIVSANPAAPVNLVEKPIHDHEQNDHGKQSGRRL